MPVKFALKYDALDYINLYNKMCKVIYSVFLYKTHKCFAVIGEIIIREAINGNNCLFDVGLFDVGMYCRFLLYRLQDKGKFEIYRYARPGVCSQTEDC